MQISVVAAIIFYQNKLLITRRQKSGNQDLSLKYEFPGGKVKKNERLKEALRRELKEELDLDLEIEDFKKFFSNNFKYSNTLVKLSFFTCKIKDLKIKLNVHSEYKLIEVNQLRTVEWLEADYPVINELERLYIKEFN